MPPGGDPSSRPRRWAALLGLAAALGLGACGSAGVAELPPPAGPATAPVPDEAALGRVSADARWPAGLDPVDVGGVRAAADGGRQVVVDRRARTVELRDGAGRLLARKPAGVGPSNALSRGRWLWVVDTAGEALLVFRVVDGLELVRRVFLPGRPYGIALDARKGRLWVTLTATNEVAELPAHGRPHELRRLPTLRQPDAVAVDPADGRVYVRGADGLQAFAPPRL